MTTWTPTRRTRLRRAVAGFLIGLVLVELFLLRHYLGRSVDAVVHAQLWWLALAVAAELVSMNCFARTQQRMLRATGSRVPTVSMIKLAYAANAINATFPGGGALSTGYLIRRLRSSGVSVAAAGFTVAASGVLSLVTFAALVLTCAVMSAGAGYLSLLTLVGAAVAAGLLVGMRRRWPGAAGRLATCGITWLSRVARRPLDGATSSVQRILHDITAIRPSGRDWGLGAGFAALNWLADLACLVAACHAVGVPGSPTALVLGAYIAGMTASGISVLPGGFGVIDVAMIFALTGDGVSSTSATAGVVLYRAISCAMVVAIGWLVWSGHRFHEKHVESWARALH